MRFTRTVYFKKNPLSSKIVRCIIIRVHPLATGAQTLFIQLQWFGLDQNVKYFCRTPPHPTTSENWLYGNRICICRQFEECVKNPTKLGRKIAPQIVPLIGPWPLMDADALCQHCTSSYFCCFCKERILFGQFFPNLGWLVTTFSIWTIFNLKFKGDLVQKMILDFNYTQSPAIAIYIFTFLLVRIGATPPLRPKTRV